MSRTRNRRIDCSPGVPDGVPHTYGTLKTLYGVRVIEVSPRSYYSIDLKANAFREYASEEGVSGWIIRSGMRGSDPIATKREAILAMVRMAAR